MVIVAWAMTSPSAGSHSVEGNAGQQYEDGHVVALTAEGSYGGRMAGLEREGTQSHSNHLYKRGTRKKMAGKYHDLSRCLVLLFTL